MKDEPTPLLEALVEEHEQQLSLKKHKSRRSSFIADTSTMLSGIMAEEVAEFNHLDRVTSPSRSIFSSYGAVDEEESNQENEPESSESDTEDEEEPEYLVPKHQLYVILPLISLEESQCC
ncbi:unnamed protein product [Ambrosiozyma monospora]|uniref:Unnamed protein product n=1 Tax=Ambrosiozyma monospora TaxID=43982 RepID=A0ACB5TRG1_AMBMO|nr:unnamed protein product [Ambrosiozyma monospora]